MSKEEISGNYQATMMERFGRVERRPAPRQAVILGADEGNIGDAILNRLAPSYDVRAYKHEMIDASRLGQAAHEGKVQLDDVDSLVLCNGFSHLDWIEEQPDKAIEEALWDNLAASVFATRDFVRYTMGQPWLKCIVYVGSMAYKSVLNASGPYCAAKAGLAHFASCMAWELAPKGYRVFIVHPSNTEGTPMTEKTIAGIQRYRGIARPEAEQYWGAVKAMPEWLQPRDIAAVVKWLLDGEADWLAGAQLDLGGGQR